MRTKITLFLIIVLLIGIIFLLFFPDKVEGILIGVLGLGWVGFSQKNKIKEELSNTNKQKKNISKRVNNIQKSRKDRQERAKKTGKDLRDRNKIFKDKYLKSIVILFICFSIILSPGIILAADPPPELNMENIEPVDGMIPVEKYYEMFQFAMFYQEKAFEFEEMYWNEVEDANKLIAENKNYEVIIETYEKVIDELMKKSGFNIKLGVDVKPLNLKNSGVELSFGYDF